MSTPVVSILVFLLTVAAGSWRKTGEPMASNRCGRPDVESSPLPGERGGSGPNERSIERSDERSALRPEAPPNISSAAGSGAIAGADRETESVRPACVAADTAEASVAGVFAGSPTAFCDTGPGPTRGGVDSADGDRRAVAPSPAVGDWAGTAERPGRTGGLVAGAVGAAPGFPVPATCEPGCAAAADMAASTVTGAAKPAGGTGTMSSAVGTALPRCGKALPSDKAVSADPEPACACRDAGSRRSGKLAPSGPVRAAVPAGSATVRTSIRTSVGSASDCWSWNGIRVPRSCPRSLPVLSASSVPDEKNPLSNDSMNQSDRATKDLDIHLVLDNYATHKSPKVKAWLSKRPRYHLHYTPTYASWLNQVERWFGLITQRALRRGSFRNVRELITRIESFVDHYNQSATPFTWVATADSIISKVNKITKAISGTEH